MCGVGIFHVFDVISGANMCGCAAAGAFGPARAVLAVALVGFDSVLLDLLELLLLLLLWETSVGCFLDGVWILNCVFDADVCSCAAAEAFASEDCVVWETAHGAA